MREKLIELLIQAILKCANRECKDCKYQGLLNCDSVLAADYLIENGVVIPVRCEECRKRKTEECGMNLKTAYYYHSWEDDEDYCSNGKPKEREEIK